MAALKYKDEHNKVGYLLKPTGSDDYHQIIDFLSASHIRALELGPPAILATIDKTPYTITEELVRSRLQLADDGGIADLPILEIYSVMDNLGYVTEGKLTFFKNKFSPQWRVTRQYKVLAFSSKLFANMKLNFVGHPLPLLPAMILQAQAGGGAEVAEQAVPHLMPSPDHSPAPLPTPSRPQTSDPVALVLEQDHSSDPHEPAAGPFLSREDTPLGGDFHTSPPRSFHAPSVGQPSGGAEDPITLTALSSVVLTLVQKVHSLEAELHDHTKLFKDVVGKLVKKDKTLEVKMKTKKRKMVVMAADSDIPSGSTLQIPAASLSVPTAGPSDTFGVPPGTFAIPSGASDTPTGPSTGLPGASNVSTAALAVPADSPNVPADSPNVPAGVSNKGKSPMVDEDIHVKARTFRQMEKDRLEAQRKRQQEVLDSAMYYNESDWLNIRAQVEANASLSKTLLDDDVSEENFLARMAALIKKKRQALAEQLFKERQNRPITLAQQKAYMRQYVKNQSRPVLEEPSTKRPKSPEAPIPSMPKVPISPTVASPPSSRTRRKSLGRKHMHKSKSTLPTLDLDAPAQTFLKVVVDEDLDDEVSDDEVWSAVVGWEVLPTPLGEINALYHIDGGKGFCAWQNQHLWEIQSWRLYTLLNIHVLETVSGEMLSMFTDVSYPLSVKLMERILMHKLEIDSDFVGNDLTTAEQLIQFIKNQIVAAQASSV
nr:JmjC domain-containing protein [Tanacetum cinerariifolium]